MSKAKSRNQVRQRRHRRVRKKVFGTRERPRLAVFRSNKHISAQIIDDTVGHTLVSASTQEEELAQGSTGTVAAARRIGEAIGKRALEVGVRKVVFDRAGYRYHGRVAAVADGARAAGLEF